MRIETCDRISKNRFVTRYTYHHGHFDGEEREFRGFGMVEQLDTEEFATLTAGGDRGDNIESSSHLPPVLTRTWFHTGVSRGRDHVSDFFAGLLDETDVGEYYREPDLTDGQAKELLLDDTVLPEDLTTGEEREACRALRGSMLRQEVFALDGTDKEQHPYTVTEQSFTIRRLQPRASNRHAVFFTHARESISYNYERKPADPRISHALTLEVDAFGNGLKSVAVAYGRRLPDTSMSAEDRAKQTQTLVTYTESHVTTGVEAADDYRTPLPCETRTYELTGYTASGSAGRFQGFDFVQPGAEGFVQILDSEIHYEEQPTEGRQRRLIEAARTYYRPDDLGSVQNDALALLPFGHVGRLALPGEAYRLAFTPGLLAQVYERTRGGQPPESLIPSPADVLAGAGPDQGGYLDLEGDSHWWSPSGRVFCSPNSGDAPGQELAYAREHFFLARRYRDPFGQTAVVTLDAHDLLMVETRDPVGNLVTVGERRANGTLDTARPGNDYRVLQPKIVMDPNRNRSAVAFNALGMVVGTALMGKPEESLGDSLVGLATDLTEAVSLDHLADPLSNPWAILSRATTRLVYDIFAYQRSQGQPNPRPPVAYTLARETHDADLELNQLTKVQHSFSYSDGFGRELHKKVQAEPGPVPQRGPGGQIVIGEDGLPVMTTSIVSPRWVGTGWTMFNNKGKPVRQYEPFFTDTHLPEADTRIGVSPLLLYDPVERVVATLHPNHTWGKVAFDAWRTETWDVNDTVLIADPTADSIVGPLVRTLPEAELIPTWHALRTDPTHASAFTLLYPDPTDRANQTRAADKAGVHADTPSVAHFDTLGRAFMTTVHNRVERNGTLVGEPYATRVGLDIEGNQRVVRDALVQNGDAQGRIVMRYDYDMLGNRIHQASMEAGARWMLNNVTGNPIRAWDSRGHTIRTAYDALRRPMAVVLRENGAPAKQVGRTVYGEGQGEATNHRGRVHQQFDQAGVVTTVAYDFKGNALESQRELRPDYKTVLDWSTEPAVEEQAFTTRTVFDALNRPTALVTPDASVVRHTYNEAGLLESLEAHLRGAATATPFVVGIDYNAIGQRQSIQYANGATTTYHYDRLTFLLTRLKTLRAAQALQDLRYTYDPAGNITYIRDDAQQTIYFNNAVVEPHADYTYDPLYRLIEATGREHIGQRGQPVPSSWDDGPRVRLVHPHDGQAMRLYTERYEYDAVGNILRLAHQANEGSWTREYGYHERSLLEPAKSSNRMSGTTVGNGNLVVEHYAHDAHGNMTSMPHLPLMGWDYRDELQTTARQVRTDGGTPETTYYVYDDAGQRMRKVTEGQSVPGEMPAPKQERIYLGGFEIYREYGNSDTVTLEHLTLHIMDDTQRLALAETRTRGIDPSPAQLTRYELGNHLGSTSLELDDQARIISYEEYTPYGSSSYQAVRSQTQTPKRYRYTGKERDAATGLHYHGKRYYACWLGRWVSPDPGWMVDGTDLFNYSTNSPVLLNDPTGSATVDPENKGRAATSRLVQRLTAKGHGVRTEVTTTGGAGGSRHDIVPDPRSRQTIAKTIESKYIDLSRYTSETGELDAKAFRARIRPDFRQVVKHEGSLRKGTKPDLPFRESLVYQVDSTSTEALVKDARQILRLEARRAGIRANVIRLPEAAPTAPAPIEVPTSVPSSGANVIRLPEPRLPAPGVVEVPSPTEGAVATLRSSGRAGVWLGRAGAFLGVLGVLVSVVAPERGRQVELVPGQPFLDSWIREDPLLGQHVVIVGGSGPTGPFVTEGYYGSRAEVIDYRIRPEGQRKSVRVLYR